MAVGRFYWDVCVLRACVLVCERLRAEGGFIESCWVAAAPEPRATKKHFIVVLWRWPCCVVNTFVCGVS